MTGTDMFFSTVQWSHLTLRVRDVTAARGFWEWLGFAATQAADGSVALGPPGATAAAPLVVLQPASGAGARPRGTAGLFHVAFLYPDDAALGRVLRHLGEAGMPIGAADHGVSQALYLSDPEGNGIELYADRPPGEWPPAQPDGQVQMFTDALNFDPLLEAAARTDGPLLPAKTRIGHVHLDVASLAHAEAFYAGALGLAVRQRSYPGALFLARDGYHHHLGANVWRTRAPAADEALGLAHVRLCVGDRGILAEMLSRLQAQHVPVTQRDGIWSMRDGDNVAIELAAGG